MTVFKRITAVVLSVFWLASLLTGCSGSAASKPQSSSGSSSAPCASSAPSAASGEADSVVYRNERYGFTFALPEDWAGYSTVTDQWQGLAAAGDSGEKVAATGPQISIRDPRWTQAHKRQDIPIMIFTLEQWNDLQQDKFHIGAAPVGPSELGRNNKYVFALPARYNFAFDDGYEEVASILAGSPLQAEALS